MRQSTRLMLNTGVTYARMLLTIGFALVSTRLFVRALGQEDYGAYMVLFAAALTVNLLTESLSTSLVRHLAHLIGSGADARQRSRMFSTGATLLFLLAAAVLVAGILLRAPITGLYQMPDGRQQVCILAFALVAARTFFVICGVPFRAAVAARQSLHIIAIFDIITSLIIFGGAIWLTKWSGDKLVFFAWMQVAAAAAIELSLAAACIVVYPECRWRPDRFSRAALAHIFGLAGWAFLGNTMLTARIQGSPMVLNGFFGTTANTAWSLAGQITGYASTIGSTILGVAGPALISAEGRGDRATVRSLTLVTSKYTTLAVVLLVIPGMLELETLLDLWLGVGNYPPNLPLMTRVLILAPVASFIAISFSTAIAATGRMGIYTFIVPTFDLGALLLALALLAFSANPEPWMVPAAIIVMLTLQSIVRAWYVGRRIGIPFSGWLRYTVLPIVLVTLACTGAAGAVHLLLGPGLIRVAAVGLATLAAFAPAVWLLALADWERKHFARVGLHGLATLQGFVPRRNGGTRPSGERPGENA